MRVFEKTRLRRHDFHGDWNYTIHPNTSPMINLNKIETLIQDKPLAVRLASLASRVALIAAFFALAVGFAAFFPSSPMIPPDHVLCTASTDRGR
jgi:hypothetical protein